MNFDPELLRTHTHAISTILGSFRSYFEIVNRRSHESGRQLKERKRETIKGIIATASECTFMVIGCVRRRCAYFRLIAPLIVFSIEAAIKKTPIVICCACTECASSAIAFRIRLKFLLFFIAELSG